MSEDYGTVTARRIDDGDGVRVEVIQSDELVCFSRELLADADPRWLRVDGDRITLCGTHFYVFTGRLNDYGDPIYRRVMNEGDL